MDTTANATSTEPLLLRDDANGISTLTLNRPKQFNALSMALLDALQSALDEVAVDPAIRVVIIAANGKAFCPGHDLKEMLANRTAASWSARAISPWRRAMRASRRPA